MKTTQVEKVGIKKFKNWKMVRWILEYRTLIIIPFFHKFKPYNYFLCIASVFISLI